MQFIQVNYIFIILFLALTFLLFCLNKQYIYIFDHVSFGLVKQKPTTQEI